MDEEVKEYLQQQIKELQTDVMNLVKIINKFQQEYNSHEHWVYEGLGMGKTTGQPKDQYRV